MLSKSSRQQAKPRRVTRFFIAVTSVCLALMNGAQASTLIPWSTSPAGEYGGIEYVEHFGVFAGTTAKGDFVMPYRLISPASPGDGNGAVLIEPSHFAFGAIGLDGFLGRDLVLGRGFSHATVGFSELLLNILAPIPGLMIAGEGTTVACRNGLSAVERHPPR